MTGYDYSTSGYYFVTICTQNRECLFGEIVAGKMVLNTSGKIVEMIWTTLPKRHDVELDEIQVMPNHVHLIINIVGATLVVAPLPWGIKSRAGITMDLRAGIKPAPTVGDIIGAFKSLTTHEYIIGVKNNEWKPFDKRLWQRNYYERIIRSEKELNETRRYIRDNPTNWEKDIENPTT